MRRLIFSLSMPRVNSWNGKWSKEGCSLWLARDVPEGRAEQLLNEGPFDYAFGDGWTARIIVSSTEPKEPSTGFCGYDWMVESLLACGEICP